MLVPLAWIACGWRELSIPCQCRFRPESKRWSRKRPPCRLGEAPYGVLPKSQRCPRTSNHDRFALAKLDFHCASSLRLGRGHRCPFLSRTSESPDPAHFGMGCNESGTNDTGHPFDALVAQPQMEQRVTEQPSFGPVIYQGLQGGRFVPESEG